MTRPVCLQIYISRELSKRVREAAAACDLSVSHWAMSRLFDACANEDAASLSGTPIERIIRQSLFVMVGIDALLSGHPDSQLRERAHQAYTRKCRDLGLARPSESEGSN